MSVLVALIVLAFLLFFLELFVPGGLLAIAGVILLLIASGLALQSYGLWWASAILFGGIFMGLLLFFIEIHLLSRTALGRQLVLKEQLVETAAPPEVKKMEGAEGVTLTILAPGGRVQIDGVAYTASTRGGYLPQGTPVRVVRADPFQLIVEKT